MADLDDVCAAFAQRHRRRLRVATKYLTLTRAFFARAGIADYRIVESAGATEGAPAAGTAEAIVDITTTGATLAANGLKVLDDGVILQSQAQLAASLAAKWAAPVRKIAETLLSRLAARERAKASLVLRGRLSGNAKKILAQVQKEAVSANPVAGGTGDYSILCPARQSDDRNEYPARRRARSRRTKSITSSRTTIRCSRHSPNHCGDIGPSAISGSLICAAFQRIAIEMRLRPEG